MPRIFTTPTTILLLLSSFVLLPIASCVDMGSPDSAAKGGRSSTAGSSTAGSLASMPAAGSWCDALVGAAGSLPESTVMSSCGDAVDTATDGVAPTTSPGPYAWKNVTIRGGGFVDGIVFSPLEKDLVFARTDMGGAYRWDPALNGWAPITDWIDRLNGNLYGIESIAPDPVDPSIVYLAAGTYLTAGNGIILRSTDRGNTFTTHQINVPMGGNTDGRSMGERLAIDPNLNSTLYFGSRTSGLMRSVDSATTWSKVATFPVVGGSTAAGTQLGLSFVLFDPRSGAPGTGSSAIYVGVADVVDGSNLYVSNDAGVSWQLVPGGPTRLMPHHGVMDSSGLLYLAYNNASGPNDITAGTVYRYDTHAGTWLDISPPKQGNYGIGGLTIDVAHPGTVVVSTLDWWNPDEIFRTTTGGASWTAIGRTAKHNPNGAEWLRWGKSGCAAPSYAGWMGDIEIDPFDPAHVKYVTGQGVWSSRNASACSTGQIVWSFENRNLEQTAVLDILPSVNGAFLSCVGDIAGMRHENLDAPPPSGMYDNPVFGNCNSLDVAGMNPALVVRVGTSSAGKLGAYSSDNGRTWKPFATLPSGTVTTGAGGRIALSAGGTSVVWTPPNLAPAYSIDWGTTWSAVTGLPTGAAVVADRVNPNLFYSYVYSNSVGTLYLSIDGGKSFAAATNGSALSARGRLRTVFGREGDVWLVMNNALYHSTEAGSNFAAVASVEAAYAVGFGKPTSMAGYPAIYLFGAVAGTTGFFRSDDAAVTWTRINDDQHQFGTANTIAGDENVYGRVYIGTNGRGILYGDPKP